MSGAGGGANFQTLEAFVVSPLGELDDCALNMLADGSAVDLVEIKSLADCKNPVEESSFILGHNGPSGAVVYITEVSLIGKMDGGFTLDKEIYFRPETFCSTFTEVANCIAGAKTESCYDFVGQTPY